MRRVELELEHKYKNRFVGKHRFVHSEGIKVVGSGRDADVRLLGDNVSGVHATFECRDGQTWVISDMGSEHGTWVQKRPIIEHVIQGTTILNIGGHHLKIVPREINSDLFSADSLRVPSESKGDFYFHQVVLRKKGLLLDSASLEVGEDFEYLQEGNVHKLKAPQTKDQWVKTTFGDVEVCQRQVASSRIEENLQERVAELWGPQVRGPVAGAVIMTLLLIALVLFHPEKPEDELEAMKPAQNQYTRMIFDAKKIKEKRETAIKLRKNIVGHSPKAPARTQATGFEKTASRSKAVKVVNSIKSAGLTSLIGKISKRAAQSAVFIEAAGQSADSRSSGRALALAGGSTVGVDGKKVGGGEGHKIGGVATDGKGGGSSAYKGVGGLSLGNVGNASVGILEEETEIEGGLDREVIARVIQSNLGQIRYCYERQLSASPDLYGKVKVKFTIGSAGAVVAQTIGTTSLNNAMVEGCILRRVAGWQFPTPKGGTQVIVSYPFLFKSTQ